MRRIMLLATVSAVMTLALAVGAATAAQNNCGYEGSVWTCMGGYASGGSFDADGDGTEFFDAERDEAVVRDEVVPMHGDDLADGIGQKRRATADEGEVDASHLPHRLDAAGVQPTLPAHCA